MGTSDGTWWNLRLSKTSCARLLETTVLIDNVCPCAGRGTEPFAMGMALNSPKIDQRNGPIPKLNDVDVGAPRNIRSLLVAMPFVPSSFLLLVARPGA